MSDNIIISQYAKGRLSLSREIREAMKIMEGDIFIVNIEDSDKLVFVRIDKEKLKNLKGKK